MKYVHNIRKTKLLIILLMIISYLLPLSTFAAEELTSIEPKDWDETAVRHVLQVFAFGGLSTDEQIIKWAGMNASDAINEILTFEPVNEQLSAVANESDKLSSDPIKLKTYCASLQEMQAFWSSNDTENKMSYADRYRYATLGKSNGLSSNNLKRTWVKLINTRGCNPFLHKMALYLTNYHAAISLHKTKAGLIRSYYDDTVNALINQANFIEIMNLAANHASFAKAYGHQYNKFRRKGDFRGNDDFAREYFQLLFRILGVTEDSDYHEDTSIEHNAWLLTGMRLKKERDAYGSNYAADWYVSPIIYDNFVDDTGKKISNIRDHYNYYGDANKDTCLEILHADICGETAAEKLNNLGTVAANHPESLDNVPTTLVNFFADDHLDNDKISAIRTEWIKADFNLLNFIRVYAISTIFHHPSTYKFKTAFDRNLTVQNANILTNEETFSRQNYDSPYARLETQGASVFEPTHDVFGGQTGLQAANNRFLFKKAYDKNVNNPWFIDDTTDDYSLDGKTQLTWTKNWGAVIPINAQDQYIVSEVADWLWNRFIGDGGKYFDALAKAQVYALLATGKDFAYTVDPDPSKVETVYSSQDLLTGKAQTTHEKNANQLMNFSNSNKNANENVGMAINFITMMPAAFIMEGQ